MKAGFIGLGGMGAHMAANLARAGFLQTVWNRTRSRAEDLAARLNVGCADDPQELARRVDAVLTCVSADADLIEVVEAIVPAVRVGTIVVDMSTVNSRTAQRAAGLLAGSGAAFLDAPVSGGVEGAKNATLAMMVGGDNSVLERVRPLLEAMAARIVHMGGTGAGQATKAVNQIMAAGINQAVSEALAFGAAQGLPLDKVIDVVAGGAAGNWFLDHRGRSMTEGRFVPGFKVALHYKDLMICKDMAEQIGSRLPLVEMTLQDYARLLDQGYGENDISALYRLKSMLFPH